MTLSENAQKIYDWFVGAPFHIILILAIALIFQKLGGRAVAKAINRIAEADFVPGPKRGLERQRERARTAGTVLRSALNGMIWLITLTMILSELGFNLGPLVASAGVIGVALGLGAQTLVRDVLAGMFMLVEDQYGVGDEIHVQDVEGKVEKVGLRITQVRDKKGVLWFLRNGEILVVGNKSKN